MGTVRNEPSIEKQKEHYISNPGVEDVMTAHLLAQARSWGFRRGVRTVSEGFVMGVNAASARGESL